MHKAPVMRRLRNSCMGAIRKIGRMANKREEDYLSHETRRRKAVTQVPQLPRVTQLYRDGADPVDRMPPTVRRLAEGLAAEGNSVRVPTPAEMDALKAYWLANPTWDIESAVDCVGSRNELAIWHDEQLRQRAAVMGCSFLMSSVLEELVRCWVHCAPPRSPYAVRLLASFRELR